MPFPRKRSCGCNICRHKNDPVDYRTRIKHEKAYGKYESTVHSEQQLLSSVSVPQTSSENLDLSDDLPLSQTASEPRTDVTDCSFDASSEADLFYDSSADIQPMTGPSIGSESDVMSDHSVGHDGAESESSQSESSEEERSDEDTGSSECPWSFKYDRDIYESGIAKQTVPNSKLTILQWLAVNFLLFVSHPSVSKAAFTHNLQAQKLTHNDTENILPLSYYGARKLIDPYVVKKLVFSVCVNECVVFRKTATHDYSELLQCPICGENRYFDSKKHKPVSRRRFIYIPIGPRLARLYGEANLAQLIMSHPGSGYSGDEMWDIHHSPTWKHLYSKNGYFKGDMMGISLALELDGVNPFHNIGVMYSMTPIMLSVLNLPRHIRNAFANIYLVGIIPGKGRSESSNLNPYLEILVDELIFLTGCTAYSAYSNAPVHVKIKLLLYVLDYPGLSKLFSQHGSGALCGCHWCFVRGEHNKALDKVIYLSNRSYLCKGDPLRQDELNFVPKVVDNSEKPKLRVESDESTYREAYEKVKYKTHADLIASATGSKQSYVLAKLPGHSRINESLPDSCHTIKDVVQNIMNTLTGNYINLQKIVDAEKKLGRFHNIQRDSHGSQLPETSAEERPKGKKQKLDHKTLSLSYVLTKEELKQADKRAESIRVPLGFGLKPSPFISKPGCLKSHDWKQLGTQGILKYCLRNMLSERCRKTLFFFFDCITELCQEKICTSDIDDIETNLNKALVLIERDFPLSLANITTHILHHIPDGIRRYGPVYGTWMYVYERFNSWICKRALNMRYPEATAIETFIIHEWCSFMKNSGKIPSLDNPVKMDTFEGSGDDKLLEDDIDVDSKSGKLEKGKQKVLLKKRDMRSIHKQLNDPACLVCSTFKYSYHKETHPKTMRVTIFTSKSIELESALTVSSYVCADFERGEQKHKLKSGKFIQFGRICYFIEHISGNVKHNLARVEWFHDVDYDSESSLWYTKYETVSKSSFLHINNLSQPLVVAKEDDIIWFLNSNKIGFATIKDTEAA